MTYHGAVFTPSANVRGFKIDYVEIYCLCSKFSEYIDAVCARGLIAGERTAHFVFHGGV